VGTLWPGQTAGRHTLADDHQEVLRFDLCHRWLGSFARRIATQRLGIPRYRRRRIETQGNRVANDRGIGPGAVLDNGMAYPLEKDGRNKELVGQG
jgi:hypothetical protein